MKPICIFSLIILAIPGYIVITVECGAGLFSKTDSLNAMQKLSVRIFMVHSGSAGQPLALSGVSEQVRRLQPLAPSAIATT